MMDGGKFPDRKTGTVKAAVSYYGERINEGNPTTKKKFQTNHHPEKPYTKTRELHEAKRDTKQLNQSRKFAESVTAEAYSDLSAAKKTVKDLTLSIEASNSRAKYQMGDFEKLKIDRRIEEDCDSGNSQLAKVLRELESVKRELSKLKLDMDSVLEEKRRAEKEAHSSLSKTQSYLSSVEALNKELEEINDEHVLVELARIEAIKEYEEIEAQRRENAGIYSAAVEETRKKKQNIIQEIEEAKELETKLAITTSDVNMLASELKQVKEMDSNPEEKDESGSASLLESVMKELEATKEELASIKEESFQFMASMDIVRNELRHVSDQTDTLKMKEAKTEMNIQNLNSKLLRSKSKLEATSGAEDKARSIVSNLTLTLEQLESEAEAAKKERSVISEETALIKADVQRTESEIDLAEERLQAALQELKTVKSSEAIALENLKALIEKTIRNRASASRPGSTITISKFEYDYLTRHAAGAKEIADKKIAAAQAWIEALKASEKEIQIKYELMRRETRELKVEEEREAQQTEGSMDAENRVENDFEKWKQKMEPEKLKPETALTSKAMSRSLKKMTPVRRGKARRPSSPLILGTPKSASFTVRRRKEVIPNLAKFFSGKSVETNV